MNRICSFFVVVALPTILHAGDAVYLVDSNRSRPDYSGSICAGDLHPPSTEQIIGFAKDVLPKYLSRKGMTLIPNTISQSDGVIVDPVDFTFSNSMDRCIKIHFAASVGEEGTIWGFVCYFSCRSDSRSCPDSYTAVAK